MACKDATKDFGGRTFYTIQLPPTKLVVLKFKIGAILGDAAKVLSSAMGESEENQLTIFMEAISTVMNSNDPEKLMNLIKELVEHTKVDGTRTNMDVHFSDHMEDLYPVALWVIKVNLGAFMVGGKVQGLMDKFQVRSEQLQQESSQTKSPQT